MKMVEVEIVDVLDHGNLHEVHEDGYHYEHTVLVSETIWEEYLEARDKFDCLEGLIRGLKIHKMGHWSTDR